MQEGFTPLPYIEIPLVGTIQEFKISKALIEGVAKEIGASGVVSYKIGTMIEVPRAALTADELA